MTGSLSTLQRATAVDPQERLTYPAQRRSTAPGRLGTLRVRLVPSGFRNLSFFMLGLLGALPSNMPRHAQLRGHSLARGVHRKALCQNGLLRDEPLNPWHPGQFSWASSKIFPSTQTEQNLGRSAEPCYSIPGTPSGIRQSFLPIGVILVSGLILTMKFSSLSVRGTYANPGVFTSPGTAG